MIRIAFLVVLVVTTAWVAEADARDRIRIVGSSTVFPFATAVAEQFGRAAKFPTPIVESTGTGGGIKLFCAGVGEQYPDIANASRAIKKSEFDDCARNGVSGMTEVKIGFDGIVIANSKQSAPGAFSREQIFLALAKAVPQGGKLVANPHTHWNQIDAKLPNKRIEVLGPPPTSGTRDAFVELVMDAACAKFPEIVALKNDARAFAAACSAIREDGPFIEAGENDNLMVQKLVGNSNAYAIFGFSFLDQNGDKIKGSTIDGVEPTFDNIASAKYVVSRSMFIYAKQQHVGVIPGIKEFLTEFTAEKAFGPEGYLVDKGLIPLPDTERKAIRDRALALTRLTM